MHEMPYEAVVRRARVFGSPSMNLRGLARYTHRTGIGNERLAALEIECCPHCKLGRWRVLEQRGAGRAALAGAIPVACRGPV
jgi:hypothetical protein